MRRHPLLPERTPMMMSLRPLIRLTWLAPVLALAACGAQVAPLVKPTLPASHWQAALPADAPQAHGWQDYHSAELLRLQAQALADNPGWQAALSRVAQARASLAAVDGARQPQLNLSGNRASSQTRQQGSEQNTENWQAGASVAYEVDLWGRLAAGSRSAQASAEASEYAAASTRLLLETDVASGYFRLCLLDERLRLNDEDIAAARAILLGLEGKQRVGAASQLDIAQQAQLLATQEAARASLLAQRGAALTALAVLVGAPPQGFAVATQPLAQLTALSPALRQPGELLARRPDIAQAEALLRAADADVDAARAAFFPKLTLSASSLWAASGGGPAGLAASLLAGLSAPLWDGGQLNAGLQRNAARRDELTANYRASLLTALKEGEDALDGLARQQSRDAALARALTAAEQSYALAQGRLRAGALDGLSLLNAQRTLIASRDSRAQSRFDSLQAGIALYKALGGGWTSEH